MRIRKPADERKREIGQAALRLAFRHGPGQVTTGMIADELGLTQPAIYKHFPRKDDIWTAVALYLSAQIAQNIATTEGADIAPDARLKALVMGHLRLVKQNPALPEFMTMRDAKEGHIALQDTIHAAVAKFRAALEKCVKSAISTGIFRANLNPSDASTLIIGVIQGLALRMMVTRNPDALTHDGERLLDLLFYGFTQTGDAK